MACSSPRDQTLASPPARGRAARGRPMAVHHSRSPRPRQRPCWAHPLQETPRKVGAMSGAEKGITAFLTGLVGVALATTLVGPGKQTPQVINAAGGAVSGS